jgi:predicted DNA-binding transcriptional regulator AlpA
MFTTMERRPTALAPFSENLIDMYAVAKFLGYTRAGLAAMLHRGEGPPYLRIGRLIRFSPDAVKAWAHGQIEIKPPRPPPPDQKKTARLCRASSRYR